MQRRLVERELTAAGPSRRPAGRTGRSVTVNLAESPLVWLHARGHLTDRQLAAGELLRRDYEVAQLPPATTMRWDPVRITRTGKPTMPGLRQAAARDRFHAAIAIAGPGLCDVLWRVVCAGESLTGAERSLGWPSRSAKLVLRFALTRLAQHYRVPGQD